MTSANVRNDRAARREDLAGRVAPRPPALPSEQVDALRLAVGVLVAHGADASLPPQVRLTFVNAAETLHDMMKAGQPR